MRVKVSSEVSWGRRKVRRLERFMGRFMRKLGLGRGLELSVVLVEEDRIRELNRMYRGRDESTDVLAFPQMAEDELAVARSVRQAYPEPLGDIVICLPVAKEQAEETGISDKEEVSLLAVHGLLHLVGFDDETDEGAERMRAMEKGLLGRNTYSKGEKERP